MNACRRLKRAVFLLRERFGCRYIVIAAAADKSAANCRQIFTRTRLHVDEGRLRLLTSRAEEDSGGAGHQTRTADSGMSDNRLTVLP